MGVLKKRPSQPTLLACIATSDSASMACSLQVIYVVGVLKKRLSIPRHSPQLLRGLITACWQDDPDLRPTFMAVCPMLQVSAPQWLRRMLICERHCIAILGTPCHIVPALMVWWVLAELLLCSRLLQGYRCTCLMCVCL